MVSTFFYNLKNKCLAYAKSTDLVFLVFLILILNVSLAVKVAGLIFIYALRPDFKFRLKSGRLPLFYLAIAVFSVVEYAFNFQRNSNYSLLALLSLAFWCGSFLIIHQLKLAIEKNGVEKVEKALVAFFVLNALVSLVNMARIMVEIQSFNPYIFSGLGYKYSASTGDYINGITLDLSTANMIMNAMGIFYFLYKKRYLLSIMCFIVATVTTSNLGNIILLLFLTCVVVFDRSRFHKSLVLCYVSFLVVFVVKVSPSNLNYLNYKSKAVLKLDDRLIKTHFEDHTTKEQLITNYINHSHKNLELKKTEKQIINKLIEDEEKKIHEKDLVDESNYNVQRNKSRNRFVVFYNRLYGDTTTTLNREYYNAHPGKYISFIETIKFAQSSVPAFIIGAGPGSFSSKVAYKASNLGVSGKYVEKYAYIAPEFKNNHLKLSLSYYTQSPDEHSILNFPNSVFNQLLGEYGIIGVILFLVFYVWFYLKKFRVLTFGKILLPMFLLFLFTDYWFESLSIAIIFETMLFIDIAKNEQPNREVNE